MIENNSDSASVDAQFHIPQTPVEPLMVTLVDGQSMDISGLSSSELDALQWEQERGYAEQIKQSTKGSPERAQVIRQGYETVCSILAFASAKQGDDDFVMGMDDRYTELVLAELGELQDKGIRGGLFEVGFGSGTLLQAASEFGYRVGGLEVASQLLEDAKARLPESDHGSLCLGDFRTSEKVAAMEGHFSLVYWNDVFEHVPVDEIDEYLERIYSLLVPGGRLITITPNWHMRPMDVTSAHLSPRSTAVGFHLKEYKLSEVVELLRKAGFDQVETPAFIGKRKIYRTLPDMTAVKAVLEPALEWLPYRAAVQACRRFGFCMTIATKA